MCWFIICFSILKLYVLDPIACTNSGTKYVRSDLDSVNFCPTRDGYGPPVVEHSPYLFDQLTRKRSRTTSSSMEDDMEEDEGERNLQNNNNRSPGSQGSSGWEVDQGMVLFQRDTEKRCLLPMFFVLFCFVFLFFFGWVGGWGGGGVVRSDKHVLCEFILISSKTNHFIQFVFNMHIF